MAFAFFIAGFDQGAGLLEFLHDSLSVFEGTIAVACSVEDEDWNSAEWREV